MMPNGRLFHSPLGLYEFQAEAVAHAYLRKNLIGVIDRGLGKTIIMMALAAQLFEDDQIDIVINIAQGNKLDKDEFPKDWAEFTSLRVHRYLGTGRTKRLDKELATGPLDVIMTTYETGKLDLMSRVKQGSGRGKGGRRDGPLMDQLDLRNKRVLWIFDEVIKLAGRSAELYQAYDYVINQLRRGPHEQRVLGLSANPFSTDWIQSENIALIVDPGKVPNITRFKDEFTYGTDDQGNFRYKKECREIFVPMFQQLMYRKRNTDPDVIDQMPVLVESRIDVHLDPAHQHLYDAVQAIYGPWDKLDDNHKGQVTTALHLTAGHPRALLNSDSIIGKAVASTLGPEVLAGIPSSKTLRLLKELQSLQGKQVLVFTWWAETVLPELVVDLRAAGYRVGVYLGQDPTSLAAKQSFKAGELDILVSGDGGARGLNLPEARYIIEYESAKTFDTRMQRFGRGTRITSDAEHVYGITLVALSTVEVGTMARVLQRNADQDHLLGDTDVEGYTNAAQRRRILQESRS